MNHVYESLGSTVVVAIWLFPIFLLIAALLEATLRWSYRRALESPPKLAPHDVASARHV
jgi:hypothetical protein